MSCNRIIGMKILKWYGQIQWKFRKLSTAAVELTNIDESSHKKGVVILLKSKVWQLMKEILLLGMMKKK